MMSRFNAPVKKSYSIEKANAEKLVELAHPVCPYSNATRGNIPVELIVSVMYCHPERSEGSGSSMNKTLRCAQGDMAGFGR